MTMVPFTRAGRIYGIVRRARPSLLLYLLISAFVGMAAIFATVYEAYALLTPDSSWIDAFFFAVGTQVTNQFTSFKLINCNGAYLVASAESLLSLVLVAVGSALFIERLIQPPPSPIQTSDHAIFDPDMGVLSFRFANRGYIPVYRVSVSAIWSHRFGATSIRRNSALTLGVERSTDAVHREIRPMTAWIQRTSPVGADDSAGTSDPTVFNPNGVTVGDTVQVMFSGSFDRGDEFRVSRSYNFEDLRCGSLELVDDGWSRMRWTNWNAYKESGAETCAACRFRQGCGLISKQS